MATIVLSAAGAAIGGSIGGSVLGLSSAAIGRFAGGLIGRSLDQRLMGQGSDVVETGRVNRLRLTGAGEGDAVAQVFGRMRLAGQVIWATEFRQDVTVSGGGGGGKGRPRPAQPTTRSYSYSLSLAIAICEGEITHLGRVWADGDEIAPDSITMRVYRGTRDQLPDPCIEAVEGAGSVPAYRGIAYVVIEDLDLGEFANRVPQFTFEVARPAPAEAPGGASAPAQGLRAVALLPGSGEYALATSPVAMRYGPGSTGLANVNTVSGKSDFATSLEAMTGELPNCGATSLIVSWFGDDLRCDACRLRPKVEQQQYEADNMPWSVAGLSRSSAQPVPRDGDDRMIYGGTPSDAAVIEAILGLQQSGQEVMVYPFILMEQMAGNGLPDPYSDAGDQPVLPWRGRITLPIAPGRAGSVDGTAAADAAVAAFFGTAAAADFTIAPVTQEVAQPGDGATSLLSYGGAVKRSPVSYAGPDEWGYRRFILHHAALCAAAGGVESFCIGSEMRGLTTIRGAGGGFPAVDQLIALAAEVREILGPEVKIGYAADWSEYFGYQPPSAPGDMHFHLDPLWADANIDFIGIDNYMPLSDWREGRDHADAGWGSIYNPDYLKANIEGGEGYEWYYHSDTARAAQIRTPITDESEAEPWVWRYKDMRNWWRNGHHDRIDGVRQEVPTPWVPMSKPIRFTEFGCAAVDKGSNQPNKFLDPKSSESSLPHFSDGYRDDYIQAQYLRAMVEYWSAPENNPQSVEYDGPMIDMDHAYAWAWDARPYPAFPNARALWSDGANYAQGHWLNGRVSQPALAAVVQEIARRAGVHYLDVSRLEGVVRGYASEEVSDARALLQPLMLRYGFDAVERGGCLSFRMRDGQSDHLLSDEDLVRDEEGGSTLEETRANAAEIAGRVRLRFIEADADFEVIAEESILPDDATHTVSTSEMPLAMTRGEGRATVERWLSEARVATDTLRFALPLSRAEIGAGDVVSLAEAGGTGHFRIDRVEQFASQQMIEAVRIEPESYRPQMIEDLPPGSRSFTAPVPVLPLFLDLPLMTGAETPHAPHLAVGGEPWPGAAALYASDSDANYQLNHLTELRARIGVTQTPLARASKGLWDRGEGLTVRMVHGTLDNVPEADLLSGANLCAIGDGTPEGWELMQFAEAELVASNTYILRHRLRGQLGTDAAMPDHWPVGSYLVMLDGLPAQIALPEAARGRARHYRIGPAGRPVDDPSYQHAVIAFEGLGLRPLSPVHLRAHRAGGDVTLNWIRRTRIDGDRWDTPDVPLGEEQELYAIRVRQGETVLRDAMSESPTWTYAQSAQAADGASGAVTIEVAQVSGRFGAGAWARLELTL
ncbi:glycoside hydrolase/phage tail family protein [Roseovarius sp.]|uniref:baseplate multidomain protein megatron n=1 Tax=Roseovarius sp. TaxID=1486281 RepID=UPI000C4CD4DA|nr:glycoside hydrolase/phage tail family protein [Roseovarius sp.]MAZ22289.1 host specificity protein [Roseovarius sp.]